MRISKYWVVIFLILASVNDFAEELPGEQSNGCGTYGIQGIIVPDATIFS